MWFKINKLFLNQNKTMVVGTDKANANIKLYFDGIEIEGV